MRNIKLALVQFESKMMDVKANVVKGLEFIKDASNQSADLIAFPELFTTGYNADMIGKNYYDLAETLEGETVTTFCEAAKNYNINIVAPIAVQKEMPGVIYNSAVVIGRKAKY